MPIIFKPYGELDVSTDAALLPIDGDMSGAMVRCKNLRLDENGVAHTRDGSIKASTTQLGVVPGHIVEQNGNRYAMGTTIYEEESSIDSGFSSGDWSSILYNAYNVTTQNIFCLNGTERRRIEDGAVYNWGIAAPTTAPVIAVGASTGLTGDYNAKYSYCRKEGSTIVCESDLSPAASSAVTLADESLDITWTASSDSQVTHVRVYRTLTDGSLYYHDRDVATGTTTLDTSTDDISVGTGEHTNHDRPPAGSMVMGPNYNGRCFIIKDNLFYFCLAKQPEYWPTTYYIEVSPPQHVLKSMCFWNGLPYVATEHDIYQIQGSGPQTFFPIKMAASTGTKSRNAFLPIDRIGIFHVGSDGIYLFSSQGDNNITHAGFKKLFRGETCGAMPGVDNLSNSIMELYKNSVFFGYRASGNSYPRHFLVYDLNTKKIQYYDWGKEFVAMCVDKTNDRLLAVDSDGYVWVVEDTSATDDGGTAISWDVQSKDYTLSTRAHFPRWAKYDVDASDTNCAATGQIVLDGAAIQSHTITGNRVTNRRLIDTDNGQRCALRVSGSGPVSIYAVESE